MPSPRTFITALVAAALLALPGAAAATPVTVKKTPISGALTGCKGGAAGRRAVFKGTMPTIPGFAGRMEMRFDLYTRSDAAPDWAPVDVDGFGEWDIADQGIAKFVITKRVSGLVGGYSYRAAVRFRWRADSGKIVRTVRRFTQPCTQPNTTPDLQIGEPSIAAGPRDDVVVYHAIVRNTGAGPSAPFDVVLAVNGVAQPAQRIGPLAPGVTSPVSFQAPRCDPGTIVRFTVDAKAEIAETNEANNALERRCAAPKAAAAAR